MPRVNPAGNGGSTPRIYTSAEYAADPAGLNTLNLGNIPTSDPNFFNVNDELANYQFVSQDTVIDAMEAAQDEYNRLGIFRGISTSRADIRPGSRAAQSRALFEATQYDFSNKFISMPYSGSAYQEAGLSQELFNKGIYAGKYFNPNDPYGSDREVGIAVALSDIPTSSSNFARPRTVAAGWKRSEEDANIGTLTVVFRDGTLWNYYAVPVDVWQAFHFAFSKGPMLNVKTGLLELNYESGPATIDLSDEAYLALYKVARSAQILYRDKVSSGNKTASTPGSQSGGSSRRVRTNLTKAAQRRQAQASSSKGTNPNAKNGINPNQK